MRIALIGNRDLENEQHLDDVIKYHQVCYLFYKELIMSIKTLGVSGTRHGMSEQQRSSLHLVLNKLLTEFKDLKYLRHGQCVGVDVEVANILYADFKFHIISHPPVKTTAIGSCFNNQTLPPKSYFARNRDIVNCSDIMLVIPYTQEKLNYGGTWYTYDYAIKNKKPTILISPCGSITYLNF